jgi:hypothetical protein
MNKENTFRALKDQDPIVDRWQCRIGMHRWLKWSNIEKKSSNLYAYQQRYCADCNHGESRKLKTDW